MTFDKAETKVENLVGDLNIPLGVEGTLLDIIDKLREEYAPTIKMNVFEYDYFRSFYFSDNSFIDMVTSISNQVSLIKLGLKHTPLYLMNLSENSLMQAWLHPETIKVVDE